MAADNMHDVTIWSLVGRKKEVLAGDGASIDVRAPGVVEIVSRPLFLSSLAILCYRFGIPPVWSWVYFWWCAHVSMPKSLRSALDSADLIVADFPFTAPILQAMPPQAKTALNTHNVEHHVYKSRFWLRIVRYMELAAARWPQSLITCSDADASFFRQLCTSAVTVIPNGVDTSRLQRNVGDRERIRDSLKVPDRHRLLLFSASAYGPNTEGAEFLMDYAAKNSARMERLRASFLIVGNVSKTSYQKPGLIVTGPVPSVEAYFSAADFAVNPIFSGSGTSVKLAEFIAARLPVLTTMIGARGFALREGESAWFFDRQDFTEVLERALPIAADQRQDDKNGERTSRTADMAWHANRQMIDITGTVAKWLKSILALWIASLLAAIGYAEPAWAGNDPHPTASSRLEIAVTLPDSGQRAFISPYIYGFGTYMREDRTQANTWSLRPPIFRFGGNMAERFNWKINAWNAGKDWYYSNHASRFPNMVDRFIEDNNRNDVLSMVTLPILGWVAKDQHSTSLIDKKSGKLHKDPTIANVAIDDAFVGEWVRHLRTKFQKTPHYYILGNEPFLWHEQHADVRSQPVTPEELLHKYLTVAKAVRKADPEAIIAGPALWGWKPILPFLPWFLQKVVEEEKRSGVRLIDVVDVHYYPANEKVRYGDPSRSETHHARMESVRSLWDKEAVDDSWIKQKIYLIPRLKSIAAAARPDLKVSIGEYNFYGENSQSGGLAVAEVLGIFGLHELDYAFYWTIPPEGSPAADAFRLYRNFDGKGAAFETFRSGAALVGTSQYPDLATFAATNDKQSRITVVLINKSEAKPVQVTINIVGASNAPPTGVRYFLRNQNALHSIPIQCTNHCQVDLPAMSFGIVEINRKTF